MKCANHRCYFPHLPVTNVDADSDLNYCDGCWYDAIDVDTNLDVIEALKTDLADANIEISRLKIESTYWRVRAMYDENRKRLENRAAMYEPGVTVWMPHE